MEQILGSIHWTHIALLITFIFGLLAAIRAFLLSRALKGQKEELNNAVQSLQSVTRELEKLKELEQRFNVFQHDLQQAELSTKVQKSRHTGNQPNNHKIPERYQYIHSLTQQGIKVPEIASILAISISEAEQLVKLANLSKK